MKTLTKKLAILLIVIVSMTFCAYVCAVTVKVKADGEEPTEQTEVVETTEETEEETEENEKVKALIGKVNEYLNTATGVWNTTIRPILIACGTSAIMTLWGVILVIKKSKKWKDKYTEAALVANGLETKAGEYKDIIKANEELKKVKAELMAQNEELKTELAEVKGIVANIRNGALQVWAVNPDAVRELSSTGK